VFYDVWDMFWGVVEWGCPWCFMDVSLKILGGGGDNDHIFWVVEKKGNIF
jgi:hypothetical protein